MNAAPANLENAAIAARRPFIVPAPVEMAIDELITHYPQKRSASLMVLHALQEQFGFLSKEAMEWTASKLELQPINIYELVTFYPMLRQQPVGKYHIKVCRTLSCALAGARQLRDYLCETLALSSREPDAQTTKDGKFTLEFVECLAGCGTGPVMMINDDFYEKVTPEKAAAILATCQGKDNRCDK